MTRVSFRLSAVALAVAMVAAVLTTVSAAPAKAWVSGTLWDPGNIISDQQFFDGDAMSTSQIQSFLNGKVPTCNTQWSSGPSDPIVCLKDYRQTTVSRAADAYCPNAYVGASNETAATIISKVARACDISPKVLLVTLQKEQGLVTHTWPSAYRYDIAMGYGCPDTGTGCIDEYYGFQNQVWRAARQFQRYRLLPTSYNYRAGVTNRIGYHPDTSCGTQSVYIQNSATAALYNYTPYVPNSAALAAIPGTGDTCSSYGNRNFFMYYWEWFGSPTGVDGTVALLAAVEAAGGTAGPLGAVLTPENCVLGRSTCLQSHQDGTVYWSASPGAFVVLGEYDSVYRSVGGQSGAMGSPRGNVVSVTESPNGPGHGQQFESGTIYSSADGAFAVAEPIRSAYWQDGSVQGRYGWPTSARFCSGTSCAQEFLGGVIAYSSATKSYYSVDDEYLELFSSSGGLEGELGVPLSPRVEVSTGGNGAGSGQQFSSGTIYASAAGAFVVSGDVRSTYWARGSNGGVLGWPIAAADCGSAACSQRFQGGYAFSNGLVVPADYADAYADSGGVAGTLGVPTGSRVSVTSPNGAGGGQQFAKGTLYSSAAGVYPVSGAIRGGYWSYGSNQGSLGWPVADPVCSGGLCSQQFQGGSITR